MQITLKQNTGKINDSKDGCLSIKKVKVLMMTIKSQNETKRFFVIIIYNCVYKKYL